MRYVRSLFIALLLLQVPNVVTAQTPKEFKLDLSSPNGSTTSESVDQGKPFVVVIINRTHLAYDIAIQKIPVEIPPLPFKPLAAPPLTQCPSETFTQDFGGKNSEADVAKLVASDREAAKDDRCTDDQRKDLERLISDLTTKTLGPYTLVNAEELKVTINRKGGADTIAWTLIASTGTPGEWRVSYGFNFVPSRDDSFYLAPSSDGKTFTITKSRRRDRFIFTPSVYFSFLSNADQRRSWAFGPVAGLGLDMTTPVVFAGGTLAFRQNISLNAGLMIHQEKRLNGKYAAGSVVTDNLTDDQLYEKTYAPRFFVGIGFRFDQNPFKKDPAK